MVRPLTLESCGAEVGIGVGVWVLVGYGLGLGGNGGLGVGGGQNIGTGQLAVTTLQALPNRFNLYCASRQSSLTIHLQPNAPPPPPLPCQVFSKFPIFCIKS